jgi:hypothetical protein
VHGLDVATDGAAVRQLVDFLPAGGGLYLGTFSTGMLRRVVLARLAVTRPRVALLDRAVRDEPSLPLARLYLGAVLFKAGDRDAARAQRRRYLELEPDGKGARLVRRALAGKAFANR